MQLQLQTIYTKLQKLVKEYEQLKKENLRLKKELDVKEQQQQNWQLKEQHFKDQVAILKTTGKKGDEAGKKELEKRINEYIRHIDKAIALLNE